MRRLSKVSRVQVGVDERGRASEVGGELVLLNVPAVVAKSRGSNRLTSSGLVCASRHLDDTDVRVLESGVGETETELVDRSDVLLVKRTVVNEDSLVEVVLGAAVAVGGLVSDIRAVFFLGATNGEGKLATGVVAAVKDVDDGVTRLLAGETSPENGSDVLVVVEVVDKDRSDRVDHNNGVVAQC